MENHYDHSDTHIGQQQTTPFFAFGFRQKQALEQIAKQQNRLLNGVVGDTIDRALNAMQEEAEYQAYNQMIENGSHGIDSSELKKRVMHNLNNRLQNRE